MTDKGLAALAKGCRRLEAVDLTALPRVGDKALVALGKRCPRLVSLSAPRCGPSPAEGISDVGCRALAAGCPKLQVGGACVCWLSVVCEHGAVVVGWVSVRSSSLVLRL